jgi:hypothetical protein
MWEGGNGIWRDDIGLSDFCNIDERNGRCRSIGTRSVSDNTK